MQAHQCFFTMVCTVRDGKFGKFGVTDVKGGNWSIERCCEHFVNSLRVCSLDHGFAVLQTSGVAPQVLGPVWQGWAAGAECPVAVFLLCFEALTGPAALGIAVLLFFARVTALQRCTGSTGHISVSFRVTVLRSCRAWLGDLGCLTWFKPKLIQACRFWSWCTMEEAVYAYKKRCWWPLNPIGKHNLSSSGIETPEEMSPLLLSAVVAVTLPV